MIKMKFNEKLRYCRKIFGLTQAQMAEELNVTKRMIAYYESGERNPGLRTINTASKFFGVSINYFLLDSETDPGKNFIEKSYHYELERYRNSNLVRNTMNNILAAGGNYIDPDDPFWDFMRDSIAEVIMYSIKERGYLNA